MPYNESRVLSGDVKLASSPMEGVYKELNWIELSE